MARTFGICDPSKFTTTQASAQAAIVGVSEYVMGIPPSLQNVLTLAQLDAEAVPGWTTYTESSVVATPSPTRSALLTIQAQLANAVPVPLTPAQQLTITNALLSIIA